MENAKFGMTGQNKVWLAGNVLIRALLQNDADLVKAARDAIASEIVLGRKEGIKDDWSFHQHGPQQQFGNYGLSFVTGMSFFFQLFKDTDYEFTGQQREILVSLIDKGYRRVIWNRYMDVRLLRFFSDRAFAHGFVFPAHSDEIAQVFHLFPFYLLSALFRAAAAPDASSIVMGDILASSGLLCKDH